MKVRIVYRHDKSVAVIHPAPKSRRPDETEADWLERVFAKAMSPAYDPKTGEQVNPLYSRPYDDVNESKLPQNRDSRDAWEGKKGKGVTINKAKAGKAKADKARKVKIDTEIRQMAEENLKIRREL